MSEQPTKSPKPLYSCSQPVCAAEMSGHEDSLWWHDGSVLTADWYCEQCWDYMPELMDVEKGIRLDEYQASKPPTEQTP